MLDSIFGAVTGGGVFGLVGSLVGNVAQFFKNKQQHKINVEVKKLEINLAERLAQVRIQEKKTSGSWDALEASIKAESRLAEFTPQWANAIRALYRPLLTTMLLGVSFYIYKDLVFALSGGNSSLLFEVLGQGASVEILRYIVYTLLFSTSAAVTWWFADRSMKPTEFLLDKKGMSK